MSETRGCLGVMPSRTGQSRRGILRAFKLLRIVKLYGGQAWEFGECHGDALGPDEEAILERFLSGRGNFWNRLSYTVAMDVRQQSGGWTQ